jgi:BlaI family transcriptional regulator, penicillinase repressor
MAKKASLSKGETSVLRTLWSLKAGSARQVFDALPEGDRREFTTIQTYLARLEAKGFVGSELIGRVRSFTPKVKPTQVISDSVQEFVNGLFGGKSFTLMKHLIDEGRVSQEELHELRRMLEEMQADDTPEGV